MNRREKLIAWGRDRLERHDEDMDRFLAYLYAERDQILNSEDDEQLPGIIRAIEAQKVRTERTQRRLSPEAEAVVDTAPAPAGREDHLGALTVAEHGVR